MRRRGQQGAHLIDRHPVLADRIQVEIGRQRAGVALHHVDGRAAEDLGPRAELEELAALRDGQLDKVDQLLFEGRDGGVDRGKTAGIDGEGDQVLGHSGQAPGE
jgi:hypothetical protein